MGFCTLASSQSMRGLNLGCTCASKRLNLDCTFASKWLGGLSGGGGGLKLGYGVGGPLVGGCWHGCIRERIVRREGKVFDATGGRRVLTMAAGREAMAGEDRKRSSSVDVEDGLRDELLVQQVKKKQEFELNWGMVALPFVFPAIGGLLFGCDIGATSGAAVSIVSPELRLVWFDIVADRVSGKRLPIRRCPGLHPRIQTRTRGRAVGLTTLVNFGSNAVVALAFALLQDLVGESNTFIIFGIVRIILLEFIITTVPETKGLNLEQIEATIAC